MMDNSLKKWIFSSQKWWVFALCCLLYVASVARGNAQEKKGKDSINTFNYQDIFITATFKPTIRHSSKIAFLPDMSSSVDSPIQQTYNYSLQILPPSIEHHVRSANISQLGFFDYSITTSSTQYLNVGYGNHGRWNLGFHLNVFPKSQKGELRILGNLETLNPSNRAYRQDYDMNVGFLGRIYLKEKYAISIQYNLNSTRYRSNFYDESSSPSFIQTPHTGQEMGISFSNQRSAQSKVLYDLQLGFNTGNTSFSGQSFQQSEFGFFAGLPLGISIGEKWKVNIKPTIETHYFENQRDTISKFSINNYIARGSLNLQYLKDNINAYLGMTIYGSSQYGTSIYPEAFLHYGMGKASPFFVEALFTTKQFYQGITSFKEINPYIKSDSVFGTVLQIQAQIAAQYNIQERFNLRLSLELNNYKDLNLVANRWGENYALFFLAKEASLTELVIRNDYIYIEPEKYELGLTITKTIIVSQKTFTQPLGRLYPTYEVYGVYKPLNHLKLRASFMGYDKVYYQDALGYLIEMPKAIYDLGFYAEYALLKKEKLRVWLDMKNILAKPYERWYGYQHPGFLFSLGISLFL